MFVVYIKFCAPQQKCVLHAEYISCIKNCNWQALCTLANQTCNYSQYHLRGKHRNGLSKRLREEIF